jgi:hypothetical protein
VSTAAPVITQPDLEAWVYEQLRGVGGVETFSYTATQTWPGWVYAHFIQVDAWAKRKTVARDRAEQARQLLVALPAVPWPDGVVCYVEPVEGPFWLPGDDGEPRYVARYEIRVHPRRDSGTHRRRPAASPQGA